jgi:hypothetical protein
LLRCGISIRLVTARSLCDIHRCPLYGRCRGHSGHQPSELSARPPAFAIGLPVALLGSLDLGGLTLLALAWRTGGDDNRFLGALQPLDLLFEFGDPLLALWQPASG